MTDTRWGRGVALPPMLQLRPRPIEHLFISRQSKTLSCLLSYYSSMHSLSFLHASLQRKMPYKFYRFARDGFLLLVLRETERTTVLRYLNCKPRDSHCRSITFSGSRRRRRRRGFFLRSFRPLSLLLEPKTPTIFRKSRFPST